MSTLLQFLQIFQLNFLRLNRSNNVNKLEEPLEGVQGLYMLQHLEIDDVSGVHHLGFFTPSMEFPNLSTVEIKINVSDLGGHYFESMDWWEAFTACHWIKQLVVMS